MDNFEMSVTRMEKANHQKKKRPKATRVLIVVLAMIFALYVIAEVMNFIDGDTNHLMNPSQETLTVSLISDTDGKDYSFIIEPNSDMSVQIKKDVYHFTVKNQAGEELRSIQSFNLENLEEDERYIDLLGEHIYFLIDISSIYLRTYEEAEETYLSELFEEETYKGVFYGNEPFYLGNRSDTIFFSLGEEVSRKISGEDTPILILPIEIGRYEKMTEKELVQEAINYMAENLGE